MSTASSTPDEHRDGPVATPRLSVVRSRDDEVRARLGELCGHLHAATAELVVLLGELDASGGWQGIGLRSLGHWASIELGIDATRAGELARAGRRLLTVPDVLAAAQAGELGWDKTRLLARVVEPATQGHWLALAREMSVGQLARVVSAYRRASDDTAEPDGHESARRRRGLSWFTEPDGMVRLTALLEPDDAAVLRAALAAHMELLWRAEQPSPPDPETAPIGTERSERECEPLPLTPGEPASDVAPGCHQQAAPHQELAPGTSPGDAPERSHVEPATPSEVDPTLAANDRLGTRRVDALVSLLRSGLDQPGEPDLADDSTQVTLCVDEAFLTGATDVGRSYFVHGQGSVPRETARRVCCDAVIRPLVESRQGEPLDLGRTTRTPNRAVRRALRHRDGDACTFPGCAARTWLAAHHVVHWADGGATSLDNMALLCRHHHRLHHEGGYSIVMVDGRPRFLRPDGTRIGPPAPPPPDPDRGAPALERRHADAGHRMTRFTPAARSGGAPHWSPQHALDALLS